MYEYRVIPAPAAGKKAKGIKTPDDRFAHALSETINAMAVDGWEYQRAETLPCTEGGGFFSRAATTVHRSMLVFRRALPQAAAAAPAVMPAQPDHAAQPSAPAQAPAAAPVQPPAQTQMQTPTQAPPLAQVQAPPRAPVQPPVHTPAAAAPAPLARPTAAPARAQPPAPAQPAPAALRADPAAPPQQGEAPALRATHAPMALRTAPPLPAHTPPGHGAPDEDTPATFLRARTVARPPQPVLRADRDAPDHDGGPTHGPVLRWPTSAAPDRSAGPPRPVRRGD